jgi:hypothetical protein
MQRHSACPGRQLCGGEQLYELRTGTQAAVALAITLSAGASDLLCHELWQCKIASPNAVIGPHRTASLISNQPHGNIIAGALTLMGDILPWWGVAD